MRTSVNVWRSRCRCLFVRPNARCCMYFLVDFRRPRTEIVRSPEHVAFSVQRTVQSPLLSAVRPSPTYHFADDIIFLALSPWMLVLIELSLTTLG